MFKEWNEREGKKEKKQQPSPCRLAAEGSRFVTCRYNILSQWTLQKWMQVCC